MSGKGKRLLAIVSILIFSTAAVAINLCHTETAGGKDPLCPACSFLNSALATVEVEPIQLPTLFVFELLSVFAEPSQHTEAFSAVPARAPPVL